MSKYAVLSDIHGNLEALETALHFCRTSGVDKYIILGDIVGYNADPLQCVEIVRSLNTVAVVRGNHDDYAIADSTEDSGFNINARIAIQWTHDQLTPEAIEFLSGLPYQKDIRECNATAVHATLDSPETWGYIFDVQHAAANFSYQMKQVCFCGHSHIPVAFDKIPVANASRRPVESIAGWSDLPEPDGPQPDYSVADMITVELERGHKYLFNVGSVGQPRNSDPRASFAIYDPEGAKVSRIRLPYDIASAQEKVLAAGLPERLAHRLSLGR